MFKLHLEKHSDIKKIRTHLRETDSSGFGESREEPAGFWVFFCWCAWLHNSVARIPTSGPRPAPKGKFVEMNEEIPGFNWAGLLMKGINVLYFLWAFFFGQEQKFGLDTRCCNVSYTFSFEIWHVQSLLNLPSFPILKRTRIILTTSSRLNAPNLPCDWMTSCFS